MSQLSLSMALGDGVGVAGRVLDGVFELVEEVVDGVVGGLVEEAEAGVAARVVEGVVGGLVEETEAEADSGKSSLRVS